MKREARPRSPRAASRLSRSPGSSAASTEARRFGASAGRRPSSRSTASFAAMPSGPAEAEAVAVATRGIGEASSFTSAERRAISSTRSTGRCSGQSFKKPSSLFSISSGEAGGALSSCAGSAEGSRTGARRSTGRSTESSEMTKAEGRADQSMRREAFCAVSHSPLPSLRTRPSTWASLRSGPLKACMLPLRPEGREASEAFSVPVSQRSPMSERRKSSPPPAETATRPRRPAMPKAVQRSTLRTGPRFGFSGLSFLFAAVSGCA